MSQSYEFEGHVKVIMDTVSFPSGFTKREFVVTEESDRYPQDIKFAMVKDNCSLLDSFKPSDRVRVTFSLRGNFYKDRYFTDLQAFRIDKVEADGSTQTMEPLPPMDVEAQNVADDDMPF